MTTLIVLAAAVFAIATLAVVANAAIRSDGYGRRNGAPSSRWPDVFDPPAWHSPRL
jgi:hypothetical protein